MRARHFIVEVKYYADKDEITVEKVEPRQNP